MPKFKLNQQVKNGKRKGIVKNYFFLYVPELYRQTWVYHVKYGYGWDYTAEDYLVDDKMRMM